MIYIYIYINIQIYGTSRCRLCQVDLYADVHECISYDLHHMYVWMDGWMEGCMHVCIQNCFCNQHFMVSGCAHRWGMCRSTGEPFLNCWSF